MSVWLLYLFALYGLFSLVSYLWDLALQFWHRTGPVSLSVLVLVHNQAEQIEGLARALMNRRWGNCPSWELIFVDLGSSDETPLILRRLIDQQEQARLVQLPREQAAAACEIALFLSRCPVSLVLDLRRSENGPQVDRITRSLNLEIKGKTSGLGEVP